MLLTGSSGFTNQDRPISLLDRLFILKASASRSCNVNLSVNTADAESDKITHPHK